MTVQGVSHHFSDGLYAKEMHLPAGHVAVSHQHHYAHLSILAKGAVMVTVDGVVNCYTAPACIEIKAEAIHEIYAFNDVVWYCIHATEETDVNKVDEVLIKEDSNHALG